MRIGKGNKGRGQKLRLLLLAMMAGLLACQTLLPEVQVDMGATVPTLVEETVSPAATEAQSEEGLLESTSIGDPFAPELGNLGYDAQHYDIQVALDPGKPYYVEGVTKIEAISSLDYLESISLDFIGYEIEALSVDGVEAEYSRGEDKLFVSLPQATNEGEAFTVRVEYQGESVRRPSRYIPFEDQIGLFYPDEESLFVLSEPDGSRFWFPCNDHPRDKASFRFEISVPAGLTAVANGLLIEERALASDNELFIWEHDYPMATYLATIAVGEYERIESRSPDGIPLRHYVNPEVQPGFEAAIQATGEAIDWMSERFGEYPFEVFGYASVNGFGASVENQTMVLLDERMFSEDVVIHEMAHMWFGDWVSLDSWGEMWRNEGFAQYAEVLWEYRDDPEELETQMTITSAAVKDNPGLEPLGDLSPGNLFGVESYIKGAAMAHALRKEMGDEAFFRGLRDYFARYGGGTASDEEFQAVMEEAVGRSLEAFFEEWLWN